SFKKKINDYPSSDDLGLFMAGYRTDRADATFTIVETSGAAYDPSDPSDEANLNIQSALAMAYPPRIYSQQLARPVPPHLSLNLSLSH
ncbi:hypothetical protein EDB86DRAFT_2918596, partial [Lactarius hatsudake]